MKEFLRRKSTRKTIAAMLIVGFIVDGASVAGAATMSGSDKGLLVSAKASRSPAYRLSGATVSGNVYVFVRGSQITQVSYYLDDPKREKPAVTVTAVAPFDLAGVDSQGVPRPINAAKLSNGRHSITAVETRQNGRKRVVGAYFTVGKKSGDGTTTSSSSTSSSTSSTSTTTSKPTTTTVKPTTTTAASSTSGQFLPAAAAGKKWSLTFSEEFNGADYDHNKLTPCFDWNYGDCTKTFNQGREVYQPSQIQLSNGIASLVAEPMSPALSDSGCFQSKCDYKSGLLSTARPSASNGSDYLYKFTYGYVESRMKISSTSGFFTAFWMLPADPSYSYDYEIDILEQLGWDPTQMFMTYHYAGRDQSFTKNSDPNKNGACADKNYGTDFHNIGVDWQPDHIAWYIDGVKCQEFTDAKNIANVPMDIIIDMMVDNQWERDWKHTVTGSATKSQLQLDYLRVYQQK